MKTLIREVHSIDQASRPEIKKPAKKRKRIIRRQIGKALKLEKGPPTTTY